jgi:hypothetical protein
MERTSDPYDFETTGTSNVYMNTNVVSFDVGYSLHEKNSSVFNDFPLQQRMIYVVVTRERLMQAKLAVENYLPIPVRTKTS